MISTSTSSGSILTTTWSAKPLATAYIGQVRITDVGVNGSTWYSDGTTYSTNGEITLSQLATGWIVHSMLAANASTFSQTGTTVTVTSAGHGLTAANHNGKSIYLILNGVGTWCTEFTYIGTSSFSCTSPTSQTASGAVTTNTSETTITPLTYTMQGGLMGTTGSLKLEGLISSTNSAGVKTSRCYYDTADFYRQSLAGVASTAVLRTLKNKTQTSQVSQTFNSGFPATSTSTIAYFYAINSAINKNITFSAQLAAANEYVAFEYMIIKVQP